MTRRRIFLYSAFALAAVLAASVGGFLWFQRSSDWSQIELLVRNSPIVIERVGQVKTVGVKPFGLSYESSGDWASARLGVDVSGENGQAQFTVEAERSGGAWVVKRVAHD